MRATLRKLRSKPTPVTLQPLLLYAEVALKEQPRKLFLPPCFVLPAEIKLKNTHGMDILPSTYRYIVPKELDLMHV